MHELHATMNLSLDGCCDHRQVIADDDFHAAMAHLFDRYSALLFGRTTYDLLEGYWPNVHATSDGIPPGIRRLAAVLDQKPKLVVTSRDLPDRWSAKRLAAKPEDIEAALRDAPGDTLLVASPTLARTLVAWSMVREYHLAVSPLIAGHGPYFLQSTTMDPPIRLLTTRTLPSGVLLTSYSLGRGEK